MRDKKLTFCLVLLSLLSIYLIFGFKSLSRKVYAGYCAGGQPKSYDSETTVCDPPGCEEGTLGCSCGPQCTGGWHHCNSCSGLGEGDCDLEGACAGIPGSCLSGGCHWVNTDPTSPPDPPTPTDAPPGCNESCAADCPYCGCDVCTGSCDYTCDDVPPDNTPTPTRTPTATPTPTPTLPPVTGLIGTCNTFGGPISLSWSYSGSNGQYFNIKRYHTSSGWIDNRDSLATTDLNPVPTLGYTDSRTVPTNEVLVGPYDYQVQACYGVGACGAFSSPATSINCPSPPPLQNFTASCTYPYGPVTLTWENSNPLPAVAEDTRHIAKNDGGGWDYRYSSVADSIFSYSDTQITPGVVNQYNIRRCFSEYGTGTGQCKYNGLYANQDNVQCLVKARCDLTNLQLGAGCDPGTNQCYRGSVIGAIPQGYNGDLGPPTPYPPFNSGLGFHVDTKKKICDSNGNNCVNTSCGAPECNYSIPLDQQLGDTITFNTNVQWTMTQSICAPLDSLVTTTPAPSGMECVNGCQTSVSVVCNPNEWSMWSTCGDTCQQQRTNECSTTEYQACTGGFCPSPTVDTPTPTNTPTATNTPPPGATSTPTSTSTPTRTPTPTSIPATATPTHTATPSPTPTTPPSEPSFTGELFYDFDQDGVYDTGCAAGLIVEKIDSVNFGCTGNSCSDCSPRTSLESLLGALPASLEGFQLTASTLGGTGVVYGENPKYRVRAGTSTGFYYFAVQHDNNYRLTSSDSLSNIRSCNITTTNPRNIYVGISNAENIDIGVHCSAMPTATPTLIPTLPINTNTPTPTNTHTPTPTFTPTSTPTPTSLPALTVTGAFEQKTGAFTRSAPGQLSGRKIPVQDPVSIYPFLSQNILTGKECHITSCENLPVSDAVTASYYGYHCSIAFPMNCSLVVPQEFGVNALSDISISKWYGNAVKTVSIPGASPPTSYTAPVTFTYTTSTGWMKVINSSIIRSTTVNLSNNIPFITDRYDSDTTKPEPYTTPATVDIRDKGHATMLDVLNIGDVGGIVAGAVDTLPADSRSQYGGSVTSYSMGSSVASNQTELTAYVQSLLTAKPINYVYSMRNMADGMEVTLGSSGIFVYKSDGSMLQISQLAGANISNNIFLITDENGSLSDVTFNNNINTTEDNSIIIIARSITLADTVTEANALFVASDTFDTGAGTEPLKIHGNIVALNGIRQGRLRADGDHARPSFLLVFNPKPYLDLIKDLTIKEVEYKIVQ